MPRERKARTWIKIDCEGVLHGSINYIFLESEYHGNNDYLMVSLACQAIWLKMIAFSETCGGRPGWIEDNSNKGLPHKFIAHQLNCPEKLFELVIKTMGTDGAIEINDVGSIKLVNYEHYQFGEYDRQRPYRLGQLEASKVESKTSKKPYGEFKNVLLTDEERAKLVERYSEQETVERIENLSSAIASKGYKYKSHYATILTWERMDLKRGMKGEQPKQPRQRRRTPIKIIRSD